MLFLNTPMQKDYGIPTSAAGNRLANQPNTNLLSATNFKFVLPKVPSAVYFCQSVSFPSTSAPMMTYKTGRAPLKLPGGEISHGDFSFTFLVNEDLSNYNEIRSWFAKMFSFDRDDATIYTTKDWMSEQGQLILLNNKKNPKIIFTFSGLFPTTLSQVEFDNTDTEGRVSVATVTLGFTYYTIEVLG